MTETLPRPIEPGDIKVGDRVQKSWSFCATDYTATFTVDSIERGKPYSNEGVNPGPDVDVTWTLLARTPEPERPVGSHWRDPETGAEYVLDDDGDYLRYRMGSDRLGPSILDIPEYTARLVPIEPDPAALWPAAPSDVRTCTTVDLNSSRGCWRRAGHHGPHAAYVSDSFGTRPAYLWGRP